MPSPNQWSCKTYGDYFICLLYSCFPIVFLVARQSCINTCSFLNCGLGIMCCIVHMWFVVLPTRPFDSYFQVCFFPLVFPVDLIHQSQMKMVVSPRKNGTIRQMVFHLPNPISEYHTRVSDRDSGTFRPALAERVSAQDLFKYMVPRFPKADNSFILLFRFCPRLHG